jgi:outer membrane lipoprotein-sorting protein
MEEIMKRVILFCVMGVLFLGLVALPAADKSADDVLKKMIDAIGGRKALENVKDRTMSGTMELVAQGMSGSMTIYSKEPNKSRFELDVMGTKIVQACDGEIAWMDNPAMGGVQEMPEQFAKGNKRNAIGNERFLNPKKFKIKYTLKEKEKVKEKECLVLEQTFADGHKALLYIDANTYLPIKRKSTAPDQMGGEVESETYLSDYKSVDGVKIAHSISNYRGGQEAFKMVISEVKQNTGLDDSLFKMKK